MPRRRSYRRTVDAPEVCRLRQRLDASAHEVLARDHRDNARRGLCRLGIDGKDSRVRIRRSQKTQVGLTRQRDIVGEASRAGEKTRVFDAAHRLSAAKACVWRWLGHDRPFTPAYAAQCSRIARDRIIVHEITHRRSGTQSPTLSNAKDKAERRPIMCGTRTFVAHEVTPGQCVHDSVPAGRFRSRQRRALRARPTVYRATLRYSSLSGTLFASIASGRCGHGAYSPPRSHTANPPAPRRSRRGAFSLFCCEPRAQGWTAAHTSLGKR